jgi:hypothetical protein
MWHGLRGHHERDDVLVQDLVVPQIVGKGRRRASWLRGHKHRGPRDPRWPRPLDLGQKVLDGDRSRCEARGHHLSSSLPRRHQREEEPANHEWQPPAVGNLESVCAEERQVDGQEYAGDV